MRPKTKPFRVKGKKDYLEWKENKAIYRAPEYIFNLRHPEEDEDAA